MKRILITGAGSYIGTSLENYLASNYPGEYEIGTVDMVDSSWRDKDFSGWDTVFHVAGIAHSDIGKVDEKTKELYYSVNTDLTIETAKKAKSSGVGQFVFMSSVIVYGDSAPIGKQKVITKDTVPSPTNLYGDSKLKAEEGILKFQDENFNVAVLRPPMVYGKGSKGHYPVLAKLARRMLLFPKVKNCRSMLYVGNLMEFIRLVVDNNDHGVFCPQNAEYTDTCEMVRMIAGEHGRKVILVPGFVWALKLLSLFTGLVNKAFGNLSYDMALSEYNGYKWQKYSLKESIEETEGP